MGLDLDFAHGCYCGDANRQAARCVASISNRVVVGMAP